MQLPLVMYMPLSYGGSDHHARNADWAGRPEAVPRNEKYNIKPYEPEDDDEYRTDTEKTAADPQAKAGAAVSGGVSNMSSLILPKCLIVRCKNGILDSRT